MIIKILTYYFGSGGDDVCVIGTPCQKDHHYFVPLVKQPIKSWNYCVLHLKIYYLSLLGLFYLHDIYEYEFNFKPFSFYRFFATYCRNLLKVLYYFISPIRPFHFIIKPIRPFNFVIRPLHSLFFKCYNKYESAMKVNFLSLSHCPSWPIMLFV